MRFRFYYLLFCLCLAFSLTGQGKTITLKKGQAFDIILLNNDPDAKDAMQDYFKRASPIARASGYVPGSGFGVTGVPTMGNYHPDVLATGSWPSIAARIEALEELEGGMHDFHEMRRKVWPTFNMTYYEVKEDISFTTDPDKYYVVTMFWADKKGKFAKFQNAWETACQRAGAKQMITLTDGASPFGYYFKPDYTAITEWASEAAFRAAQTAEGRLSYAGVRHLNQFPIK